MLKLLPEEVIGKLKRNPAYRQVDRVQAEALLHAEENFVLRPSSLKYPLYELFVLSYRSEKGIKHDLYGLSTISGQCFQFEATSASKVKPTRIINQVDYNDLKESLIQQSRHSSGQKGIILSTQTPDLEGLQFPRRGGTAIAINHVTGLPWIQMHRNGSPLAEEENLLKQVRNNGVIFITGHGSEGVNILRGQYLIKENNQEVNFDFPLTHYRDLIVNHTSLRAGDEVKIVLMACEGASGENSIATQLGQLLLNEGINSKILCSVGNIRRFNGSLLDVELAHQVMRFPNNEPGEVRLYEFSPKGMTQSVIEKDIYFNSNLISTNLASFSRNPHSFFKELTPGRQERNPPEDLNPDLPHL